MDDLRAKCPWDKKQTLESLRHLTIEEVYELGDAILDGNMDEIKKELGDLLLHMVFYAKIGSETGDFDIGSVAESISDKLVERHPHIYGDFVAADEIAVKQNWEKLKLKEGKKSVLEGVPKNQWFYTGMDCYIHCIESLTGTYLNAFSQSYGEKSLDLCREVYLEKDEIDEDSQDKLMMASWHGGMSIAYSQVGVAHAMSYGLSYLLGTKHGVGNCIVFDQLSEFYPEGVKEFKQMVVKHGVDIPKGLCKNLSDQQFDTMINVALSLVPLWENALGKNWQKTITREKLRSMYELM